ncbi:Protein of unknown function [Cotesia congregata]|uniref:FLYWCH-type domain-containing protein n=1 Tax=Cotesia congregata TaxID=51543 RepID=A0A8J2E853_COTCN|nr:Protein of unknown function [Cotesia congregata]
MEIIRGKKEDSTLFFYKGFKYLEDKLCKRVARCSSRKLGCKATLHFIQEISDIEDFENLKEGTDFNILKEHTEFEDTRDQVSVFNALTDTNDGPESFHRHCNSVIVERHPIIWSLIDRIEKILKNEELNYERLLEHLKTKRHTPRGTIIRKNYVKNLQNELLNQKITVEEFLKSIPRCFNELLQTVKIIISHDEASSDSESEECDPSQFGKEERKNNTENKKKIFKGNKEISEGSRRTTFT